MPNWVKKSAKDNFFGFLIIPFAPEPAIIACADPTLCEVISCKGQGQLCQLTKKHAILLL